MIPNWYRGVNDFGWGGVFYSGWEIINPPGHNCGGLQIKVWKVDGQWYVVDLQNIDGSLRYRHAWGASSAWGGEGAADGEMRAEIHCNSCPCMCAASTFGIEKD